jgi:hypothetical protein
MSTSFMSMINTHLIGLVYIDPNLCGRIEPWFLPKLILSLMPLRNSLKNTLNSLFACLLSISRVLICEKVLMTVKFLSIVFLITHLKPISMLYNHKLKIFQQTQVIYQLIRYQNLVEDYDYKVYDLVVSSNLTEKE